MQPLANITPLKPAGAIEVRNVGQIFKTTTQYVVALEDVSLELPAGRHTLRLVNPVAGLTKDRVIELAPGETLVVRETLSP